MQVLLFLLPTIEVSYMFWLLQVWSSSDYHLVSTFTNPSPLNCVTFDPEIGRAHV